MTKKNWKYAKGVRKVLENPLFATVLMLIATLTSLIFTVVEKVNTMIEDAQNAFACGNWFQMIFAAFMAVLAVFLVIEGIQTFTRQRKNK